MVPDIIMWLISLMHRWPSEALPDGHASIQSGPNLLCIIAARIR